MNSIIIMLPIISLIFTGWILAKVNFFNSDCEIFLNKITFNLGLPAIMILSINQNGIKNIIDFKFSVGYTLSIIIPFSIAFFIFRTLKNKALSDCIFIGMNASVSNSGLVAMPILLGIFGVKGGIPVAAMLTICSILIIPTIILLIEHSIKRRQTARHITFLKNLLKTSIQPFILATIAAAILNAYAFHFPKFILSYLQYIADTTIPCALISIGIRLSSSKLFSIQLDSIYVILLNLVVKPIIAILLSLLLHLSKLYSTALIVVSAAPVANSIYIFAAKYNIYKIESAEISFFTMVLSLLTLPLFVWIAFKLNI